MNGNDRVAAGFSASAEGKTALRKRETKAHRDVAIAAVRALADDRAADMAADMAPVIADLRAAGATTLRAIAEGLNARGLSTARGGQRSAVQVSRTLERIGV